MTLYLDPPVWPAHGTVFSHLVSDLSLTELHDFAADAGIPGRAFDRDHYDVPARRYTDLVRLGAVEVSGKTLARLLISSGLRVRARDRNESLERALLQRWTALLPGREEIGRDLLGRWGEPHRHYHGRTHLLAVLEALVLLHPEPAGPVLFAAWFHDAVYRGVPGADEEHSAQLAESALTLAGLPAVQIRETARLVRLTANHIPGPADDGGALLCDADLSVLGGSPEQYGQYLRAVRADYAHVSDADFATGRAVVVRELLKLDPLFHTPAAQSLWLRAAQRNLEGELAGGLGSPGN
ncbi:DUF4031 domain-containing protein [Paenarthrobacter sp. PH39-S1]|uniref:DUF4031 domain-containing protein n=1 Tax=Paenarthrobacter sp. PH39-S1 TaxID=3046204 RepID=UPI0024BA0051|nr:DUF4031 domain-containing protein [Paenarthrobacter sp. PH39-S1]MDJ0355201.1 DUF4031 domain-containing protein [Paenarthrobacter sp. PH39-S1]